MANTPTLKGTITLPPGIILNLGPKLIPVRSYPLTGVKLNSIVATDSGSGAIELNVKITIQSAEIYDEEFDMKLSEIKNGEKAYWGFLKGTTELGVAEELVIYVEDQFGDQNVINANMSLTLIHGQVGGGAHDPKVGGGAGNSAHPEPVITVNTADTKTP